MRYRRSSQAFGEEKKRILEEGIEERLQSRLEVNYPLKQVFNYFKTIRRPMTTEEIYLSTIDKEFRHFEKEELLEHFEDEPITFVIYSKITDTMKNSQWKDDAY